MRSNASLLMLFFLLTMTSCGGGMKTQSSGKAGNPFIEFFVEPGVSQYFIGPLKFSNAAKQKLEIDYTLRDSTKSVSPVALNFTLFTDSLTSTPDSLVFYDAGKRLFSALPPFDRFYVDKDKVIKHRYGAVIDYAQMKKTVRSTGLSVSYWTRASQIDFELESKSQKILKVIDEELIDQIEFTKQLK